MKLPTLLPKLSTVIRKRRGRLGLFAAVLAVGSLPMPAIAVGECTASALWAYAACRHDWMDDYFESRAICINESDTDDARDCLDEAREARGEAQEECQVQREGRTDFCDVIGEAPYDPEWEEIEFEDPLNVSEMNPYYPLIVGRTMVYQADEERITLTVQNATKFINLNDEDEDDEDEEESDDEGNAEDVTDGVHCIVFNDLVVEVDEDEEFSSIEEFVTMEGENIEDTDDWYAQDADGNIWYCGEIAVDFEQVEGDFNEPAELVSIDGSFKHNRDGARAGIIMLANPQVGDVYRQEMAIGDAEDAGEIVAVGLQGMRPEDDLCDNDLLVDPEEVANKFCALGEGCIVIRDFVPTEPDVEEFKYYAYGIGLILEVEPEEEACAVLVSIDGEPVAMLADNEDEDEDEDEDDEDEDDEDDE